MIRTLAYLLKGSLSVGSSVMLSYLVEGNMRLDAAKAFGSSIE